MVANRRTRDDSDAVRVWLILYRAAHAVQQNALHSVAAQGLGLSDFAVLELLLHKGSQTVNVIGKNVLLTSGSITTAIDRLETKGLARRVADKQDQRARIVELTAPGRALIEKAFRRHREDLEETLAVLSANERKELVRLLKKAGLSAAARLEKVLSL